MIRHNGIEIDRKARTIANGEFAWRFNTNRFQGGGFCGDNRFRLVEHLILNGGATSDDLFDLLYAHDPDGGPINGTNAIQVMLSQLVKVYAGLGMKLRRERHNGRIRYSLVR